MLETLFWVGVGALVGWHVPQPIWVKLIVEKVKETLTK